MFGLTFEKLLLIGILAVFLLGPDRLPHYASQLARLVRSLRALAGGARERMREEMGPEFDEVDWKKLDPRQYDPRRIIREALSEDIPPLVSPSAAAPARPAGAAASTTVSGASVRVAAAGAAAAGGSAAAPFDGEAT